MPAFTQGNVLIAILGSLDGNVAAFEAVLADAAREGAERVVCAGDVVSWGPQPREALALLRARNVPAILGHDDRRVVDLALDVERGERPRATDSARWTLARLDQESVRTLAGLPLSYGFTAGGLTVVLVHGTPRDDGEELSPETPERTLEAHMLLAGASVLACARGPEPFVRFLPGRKLVVSTGSVGRPRDGDPRSSYVLLKVSEGEPPRASVRRVEHDVSATLAAAEAAGSLRRVRDELRARAEGAARGEAARGLVLTAPYRRPRSLVRLARMTIERASSLLYEAGRREDDIMEATHDGRVATRRLASALDLFSALLPVTGRVRAEKELTRVRRRLARARDLDVAREVVSELHPGDATLESAVDAAREALDREKDDAERERRKGLRKARNPERRERLRELARAVSHRGVRTIARRIEELAREARERLQESLAPQATDESVHAFRVAVKRLRYALEPLEEIDPPARTLAEALRETQDSLGRANDRAVLAARLRRESDRLVSAGCTALAEALSLLALTCQREARAAIDAFRREGLSPRARAALALGERPEESAPVPLVDARASP
ncbi:CHAD domain-containing protein [bacterium]|nr:CHAD domain-containing protein [bacterium]